MADRGSGCMGQARPNLSNQAYRPDAEPPAAGPGQTGGTPLPGGPTARLCYFSLLLHAPLGGRLSGRAPLPRRRRTTRTPTTPTGPDGHPLGVVLQA